MEVRMALGVMKPGIKGKVGRQGTGGEGEAE
jgi:hypothetical protein